MVVFISTMKKEPMTFLPLRYSNQVDVTRKGVIDLHFDYTAFGMLKIALTRLRLLLRGDDGAGKAALSGIRRVNPSGRIIDCQASLEIPEIAFGLGALVFFNRLGAMADLDSLSVDIAFQGRIDPLAKAVFTLLALILANDLSSDWAVNLSRVVARILSGDVNANSGNTDNGNTDNGNTDSWNGIIGSDRGSLDWC